MSQMGESKKEQLGVSCWKKWKNFASQKEILSQWRLRNFWMTLLEKQLSRMSFSIQNDPKVSYKANKKNPLSQNCMSEKPAWLLCLLKLPLPEDLVGVTASERGLSPAVRTRVCAPGTSPRCAWDHTYQVVPASLGTAMTEICSFSIQEG